MAEVNDIRSLLTSKSRARVAPRDTSLTRKASPFNEELLPDAAEPDLPDEPQLELEPQPEPEPEPEPKPKKQKKVEAANSDNLPTMGKRLAVHLEQGVRSNLVALCDRQDLTPEIFFEAATVFLQAHPDLLDEVITDAKQRLRQRKQAGLVRRTKAMMQKYGGEA